MNNYFDITVNGVTKRAYNQVLNEVGQAFSQRRNFTDFLALGSGTEIRDGVRLGQPVTTVSAVVTDLGTDEWEGRLFVTRSAEVSVDTPMTIREIGFTYENTDDPRLVTYAVFDEPIEIKSNDTVTVTAHLFLDLERNTQMRLTRGDNIIARAMLGIEGLPADGFGIWRSTVNLPNINLFRKVPDGDIVTPVDTMLRIESGLAWRFQTGAGNPNFEMFLCFDRVPQARINYRSHLMSLGSRQVICAVNGALEVAVESQIFERMVSLMRSNQSVPHAASRFSYNLDEVDNRNMPVKFAGDCKAVTDFDGRYIGVISERSVKMFDAGDVFRPLASQNIEVERYSAVGIGTDGTVFVSAKGRLTAYKLTDGGYFEAGDCLKRGVKRTACDNSASVAYEKYAPFCQNVASCPPDTPFEPVSSAVLDSLKVRRVMVSSVSPMLVCVETDRGVKFFRYNDSGFSEIFSVVSGNPVFLHQPDGNRIQFFTDGGASGEFAGAVRRDFTPEFATALRSQVANINQITKMRSSGGVLLAEVGSENRWFLIASHLTNPIPLPATNGQMNICGQYLTVDYGDKYQIFYISVAANRCVSVQVLDCLKRDVKRTACDNSASVAYEKYAPFGQNVASRPPDTPFEPVSSAVSRIASIAQCGQWVIVLFKDGTTRLFASRFDSLALSGNFETGQVFTATVFARSNFSNNENVEIIINVK